MAVPRQHFHINKATSRINDFSIQKLISIFSLNSFRPIDHERNDSGAASPAEMLRIRKYSVFLDSNHRKFYLTRANATVRTRSTSIFSTTIYASTKSIHDGSTISNAYGWSTRHDISHLTSNDQR